MIHVKVGLSFPQQRLQKVRQVLVLDGCDEDLHPSPPHLILHRLKFGLDLTRLKLLLGQCRPEQGKGADVQASRRSDALSSS